MRKIFLSPSLLAANFACLEKQIKEVESSGAEYLHFDVMDGVFVNNISFGIPVLKSISKIHSMINDVHIMIANPKKYVKDFLDAGADVLTFHFEACKDENEINSIIDIIKNEGKKVGISIKPSTDVNVLLPYLNKADLILIMSVEPGFGGQKFMDNCLPKIAFLRQYIDENKLNVLIEVDGGIDEFTSKLVIESGVDILVAGSSVFNGDIKTNIKKLR